MMRSRLLVVDDDVESCAAMAEALRAEGTRCARRTTPHSLDTSGKGGLRRCRLGYPMPDLDGLGLLRVCARPMRT